MSVEITVEPAPTTPVITVNPAGEVTCTVTYSTLTGSINNPGGANGSVQIRNGASFAGIAPDTDGNVLTISDGEWVSATPDTAGMVDPGSNGVVVRTALNTTTARTIAAGTNVSVNNGSGVSGDPTISVADASTTVKGVVELATDGEVASGLAVQANDARLSNARTPTAHASTHVTGGADKIRNATASQDGLMTTAYASKLDAISGTNTGDQTITLTGDVTGSGTGSFATTIANQVVTFAKMQHISTAHLLGRHTSGSGDVQQIGIDGGLELQGSNLRRAALTGDVTASAGSNTTTIANGAVTATKMATSLDLSEKTITLPAIVTADNATDSLQINDDTATAMAQIGKDGANNGTVGLWDSTNGFIVAAAAVDGGWSLDGEMTAVAFIGNGSQLGNMSANNISAGTLALARGGTGSSLTDPNADRLLFWDDSASQVTWLTVGGGLAISGTTITASGSGDVVGPASATDNAIARFDLATGKLIQNSGITIADGVTGTLSGTNTGDVTLAGTPDYITISGQTITRNAIDLATDITGVTPVANGGTGAATLTANNVLLGNGTSALQAVAPGTNGNVLTSDGTTWTSAAPATTNPAGSGSELQFRSSGTAFGAVTNSSVSGGTLTLGNAEALATTPTAYLTLRNTTAAAAGLQQVSPSLVLEGRGWKTDATAGSQTVRFRQNILPVQGTANPSATWRLQSEINNSGTWTDRATMTTPGVFAVSGDSNTIALDAKDSNNTISATRHITITPGNGWTLFLNAPVQVASSSTFGFSSDVVLARDAANILAQRNATNAQTFRLYETDSGANDEYLEFSAASGTNLIRPQATGTGTASVVRYHTTTAVFWTSGSGSPESVVTAPVGSLYTRTDGGAATTLYVKESGTGSTGWVAK